MNRIYLYILITLILAGCSSSGGRYDMPDDQAPDTPLSVEHIEDAVPQYEPYSFGGNKDYNLRGQSYRIIKNPKGSLKAVKPLGMEKNSTDISPQTVKFMTCTQ